MGHRHLIVDEVAGKLSLVVHDVRPAIPGMPTGFPQPTVCVEVFADVLEHEEIRQMRDYFNHVLAQAEPGQRIRVGRDQDTDPWRVDVWAVTCPEHQLPGRYVDQPTATRAADQHLRTHHQELS